ncbi:hypothetical protein BKA80DRAFT_337049 [Phyllosticta citrichinensis]
MAEYINNHKIDEQHHLSSKHHQNPNQTCADHASTTDWPYAPREARQDVRAVTTRQPLDTPSIHRPPELTEQLTGHSSPEQRRKEGEQGITHLQRAMGEASAIFARLNEGDKMMQKRTEELLMRPEVIRARQRIEREQREKNECGGGKNDGTAVRVERESQGDEGKEK